MNQNSKHVLAIHVFIALILIVFGFRASTVFADTLIIAKTERYYSLIGSIFTESKPKLFESFNLRNVAGKWFLVTGKNETELIAVKVNDEVIVLRQPVTFSGFRNFIVYLKSYKFSISEMSYSIFPEVSLRDKGVKENISVWFGSFVVR